MRTGRFDIHGFHSALDVTRKTRGMTWQEVATATGVSPALLSRLKHGHYPSVPALLALSQWASINPLQFMPGAVEKAEGAEPMAVALMAINGDPKLPAASRAVLSTVLLTTYQQLAAHAPQPVAVVPA